MKEKVPMKKHFENPNAFIEYSNNFKDVYIKDCNILNELSFFFLKKSDILYYDAYIL